MAAAYGQTMVLIESHEPVLLDNDGGSSRDRVHADLVAEAAPNLAAIRTMLAEEIEHQVSFYFLCNPC